MFDFGNFFGEFHLELGNLLPEFANLLLDFLPEFANLLTDFANLTGQFLPGRGDLGAQLASVFGDSIACGQVFGRERLGGLFSLLFRDASRLECAVYL